MSKELSQPELVEPFHKKAVVELIVVECAPGCYRFETLEAGRTVTRLELPT